MKILIFRTHPTTINISSYNVQELGLAKALIKNGHQCDILFWTDEESKTEIVNSGSISVKIMWMHGKNFFWQGIFDWNELKKIIDSYDLVQVNEYNQIATYMVLCRFQKKCVIYHGPYYNEKDWKSNFLTKVFDFLFLKRMINLNPLVLSKSELAAETLKKKGFKRIKTVSVGLDIERFLNMKSVECRHVHENAILYIGEISERRNTLFLIDVFSEVHACNNKIKMTMIGKGRPEYEKMVSEKIISLNLSDSIIWIKQEKQENLPLYYKYAKLFIFPSNYEIFGMVLLEACFFHLPIVSSLNGGSRTLSDRNYDITILPLTKEMWVKTIIKKIDSAGIGRGADTDESVSWDHIVSIIIQQYESVLFSLHNKE